MRENADLLFDKMLGDPLEGLFCLCGLSNIMREDAPGCPSCRKSWPENLSERFPDTDDNLRLVRFTMTGRITEEGGPDGIREAR